MARSVICDNCGHRIAVDEGYTRRKIRCPECGVLSEVTDAPKPGAADPRPAKRSAPSAPEPPPQDAEELARQLWSEPDEKPPPKKSEPPPPPSPREKKPELVPEPPVVEVVERKHPPESPEPPKRAAQTWTEEDEDSSPYDVSGGPERKCPQCFCVLESEAVLCVRCGLDLKSGKKLVREFKPMTRSWEPGSFETRVKLFCAAVFGGLVLSVLMGLLLDAVAFSFGPWLCFVVLMGFLLGTFDRIDLVRDKRGHAKLTRTWRVCFVRCPPTELDLLPYDAVVTGVSADAGCYEWFIAVTLLPLIVPAIVWWYQIIHKKKFYAALAHSHNYPEVTLYRGNSHEQAEDIAETLRDAARLRYERV